MTLPIKRHIKMLPVFLCFPIALISSANGQTIYQPTEKPLIAITKESLDKPYDLIINGIVKVDFIYDFKAPSGDRINYTNISTKDSNVKGQTRIHARESRFSLKFLQDVFNKKFTAFIEGDFYGGGTNSPTGSEKISNSVSFRLRHAYISYEHWLAGQTWSNYVDVKSFPETLDFSNETGQSFIRQGQLRYQHDLENLKLSYSIENPETDVHILTETFSDELNFNTIDPSVDVTAKAKYQFDSGHLSVQTVLRKQKIHSSSDSISDLGYGIGTSGKVFITPKDIVKFHYSQGGGIGRYIQEVAGSSGLVIRSYTGTDKLSFQRLKAKGGYFGYQHIFSEYLRANINSGFIDIDYSSVSEQNLISAHTEEINSIHGNVIWTFFPDFEVGIEHSIVKVKKVSGDRGSINRVQLSTKYRF